jgi:hypothetical protein
VTARRDGGMCLGVFKIKTNLQNIENNIFSLENKNKTSA